jgi:hypothetical protein
LRSYKLLQAFSLVYISLPVFLFILGWLRPLFSIPVTIISVIALYRSIKAGNDAPPPVPATHSERNGITRNLNRVIIIILVFAAVATTGIGGYAFQRPDYGKHNAVFRDLMEAPWPLAYQAVPPDDHPGFFNGYMAYYLPAAAFGKLAGWTAANHFSYLWSALGVLLTVLWFLKLIGKPSPAYVVLFLLFGGVSILGQIILLGWDQTFFPYGLKESCGPDYWMPIYIWSKGAIGRGSEAMNGMMLSLGGSMTWLVDGVHHVLPGWIIVLMLLHDGTVRKSSDRVGFLWACAPIASAFVAVGLAPFVFLALYQTRFKKAFSFQNLAAAPLMLLITGLFLISGNKGFDQGWVWHFVNMWEVWPNFLLFYFVSFGLYATFFPGFSQDKAKTWLPWWYLSIALMAILPLYRMGLNSELQAKGSMPSQAIFLTCLAISIAWAQTPLEKMLRRVLILLLIIGSFGGIWTIGRAIGIGFDTQPPALTSVRHLDVAESGQIFSPGNSFFWRFLAKRQEVGIPASPRLIQSFKVGNEKVFSKKDVATVDEDGFTVVPPAEFAYADQQAYIDPEQVNVVEVTISATVGDRDVILPAMGLFWARQADSGAGLAFSGQCFKDFVSTSSQSVFCAICKGHANWNDKVKALQVKFKMPRVEMRDWEYLHVRLDEINLMRLP